VTPFRPKGLINPSLNIRFLGGLKGVDGLPSGYPNLNGSHPGSLKDFPKEILVIEMLLTYLRPKEVEDEAVKDVKRLFDVGEAPYMVPLDPGKVIFSLSKTASPNMTNGQERVTSLDAPHFCQT
jgi:hypothetical protein